MGKIDLISGEFWQTTDSYVLVNPRDQRSVSEAAIIQSWIPQEPRLKSHLLFSTSGSTGAGKWVALSRAAILASARAVNEHLAATSEDRWLLALPDFHVGGISVYARCYESSCDLVKLEEKWNAEAYYALAAEAEATLSALVPTQLVDLVNLKLKAPPSLRALIIGGGRLEDGVYQKAVKLGWPIMETYGMTETCSQVATAELGHRAMKILPLWQAQLSADGKLMVSGDSMMTGYVSCPDEVCQLQLHDGWLITNDLVELEHHELKVLGRSDRCVKILGELVNLAEVERSIIDSAEVLELRLKGIAVITTEHTRSGQEMVACCEDNDADHFEQVLAHYHQACAPFKRIKKTCVINQIPRSPLGKVRYAKLAQEISSLG